MSEGIVLFLLALLLSVPISIVGSLVAPRLDGWWSRRSDARSAVKASQDAALRERAARFHRDRDALNLYLWSQFFVILRVVMTGVVALVLWAAFAVAVGLIEVTSSAGEAWNRDLVGVGGVIAIGWLFGTTIVGMDRSRDAIQMVRLVNAESNRQTKKPDPPKGEAG